MLRKAKDVMEHVCSCEVGGHWVSPQPSRVSLDLLLTGSTVSKDGLAREWGRLVASCVIHDSLQLSLLG